MANKYEYKYAYESFNGKWLITDLHYMKLPSFACVCNHIHKLENTRKKVKKHG